MYNVFGKYIVLLFGVFFIVAGLIMLFKPSIARATLRKAGSTDLINYAEITLRIIPAIGLILAAPVSKYPGFLLVFGWFMLGTSLVLYFVPRRLHHHFSTKAADVLQPIYFQFISPFSILMGLFLIVGIW